MTVIFVTGTGTDVGKTIVTAAVAELAALDEKRVAVLKPAQTGVLNGEPGDVDVIERLTTDVTCLELARFPDPLAPRTAARRAQQQPLSIDAVVASIQELHETHDIVLVEGAGGLLVQFDEQANTLAEIAAKVAPTLEVQFLVVVSAGLGTLNMTALTAEALRNRRLELAGLVIGRWREAPDLAERCNLRDLSVVAAAPILGVLPDNFDLEPQKFRHQIAEHFAAELNGTMDIESFIAGHQRD